MSEVRSNTAPLEFASLTKNQKRLVRKLAWENLKSESRLIVIIPVVIGCVGALTGIFAGVILGQLAFSGHQFRCFVICAVTGVGISAWIGRMWMERECQSRFKNIIMENEDRISRIV